MSLLFGCFIIFKGLEIKRFYNSLMYKDSSLINIEEWGVGGGESAKEIDLGIR